MASPVRQSAGPGDDALERSQSGAMIDTDSWDADCLDASFSSNGADLTLGRIVHVRDVTIKFYLLRNVIAMRGTAGM